MNFISNIIQAFGHGGFVMWIIFFEWIFSIAIIIEKNLRTLYGKNTE